MGGQYGVGKGSKGKGGTADREEKETWGVMMRTYKKDAVSFGGG